MSFDDSIQQLRNEQLARQSDAERFISVKTLFEQIKQALSRSELQRPVPFSVEKVSTFRASAFAVLV